MSRWKEDTRSRWKEDTRKRKGWWEGIEADWIDDLKENWSPLCRLEQNYKRWMAQAFREMPAEDRVFLTIHAEWKQCGGAIIEGLTYRLRSDWERPEEKSELVKALDAAGLCVLHPNWERTEEKSELDELTNLTIEELKRNWEPLCKLSEDTPELSYAFCEMPFDDLVYLDGSGDWLPVECPAEDFPGTIYRLRDEWQRPEKSELVKALDAAGLCVLHPNWERIEEKSELVKGLEEHNDKYHGLYRLTDNTSPLNLMDFDDERKLMQQALEAGLCEHRYDGKWTNDCKHKAYDKHNFAVRLAPDWRERLKQKGGEL